MKKNQYDEPPFWFYLVVIVVCILLLIGVVKWDAYLGEVVFRNDISQYTTLVVNGEEYNTEDIVSVECMAGIYQEDKLIITLKDGTKVFFLENTYTLKNKK